MRNINKPNRYNVASIQAQQTLGGDVMQSDEEGQYVEWRDYKRALDEIEMLKHSIKYWEIEAKVDHDRWLRCLEDNERLRKAGDAVALDYAERIEIEAGETAKTLMKIVPVLRDWNAAKEGKQS